MATAKQFTEKMVVSDKLVLGNFGPMMGVSDSKPMIIDHLLDGIVTDSAVASDAIASDVAAVDQPLLMAKADIEIGEHASSSIASDADITYTDHISSDLAEAVSDQHELVAMNTIQHITDSTVLAEENAAGAGGIPWMWMGAAAIAGGGLGVAFGANHGGNDAAPAAASVDLGHIVVEREGAFVDVNADGIHQTDGNEVAISNADLSAKLEANDVAVTIHFNDVPMEAINLTGFGEDDKIQFDVTALHDNKVLANGSDRLGDLDVYTSSPNRRIDYTFTNADVSGVSFQFFEHSVPYTHDFNDNPLTNIYFLRASYISSAAFDRTVSPANPWESTGAAIAYWNDGVNALNNQSLMLPYFTKGVNTAAVIANLNSGSYAGVVEFVNPIIDA